MAYSFYGGKEGRSFTIVERYKTIADMVTAFAQGGAYTDVGFGEFVIIDTVSKENYENGCVYRRGFDYNEVVATKPSEDDTITTSVVSIEGPTITVQKRIYWNDTWHSDGTRVDGSFNGTAWNNAKESYFNHPGGGAEYVGQIVGPQGASANVEAEKWSDFLEDYSKATTGKKAITILDSTPGYKDGTYVDGIKFGYCTFKAEDGTETTAIIGFDIPYTVFDVEAAAGSSYGPTIKEVASLPSVPEKDVYYHVTGATTYQIYDYSVNQYVDAEPWTVDADFNYNGLIRREAISDQHPYFEKYQVTVPKGRRGNSITELGFDNNYQFFYDIIRYDRLTDGEQGTVERQSLDSYLRVIDNIVDNSTDISVLPLIARSTAYETGDRVRVSSNNNISLQALNSGTTQATTSGLPDLSLAVQGSEFTDGEVVWQINSAYMISPNLLMINYTHGDADEIPFRVLNDIQLDGDGRIYANYSDVDTKVYLGKNQSITALGYNPDPRVSRFYIIYNTYARSASGEIIIDNTFVYNEDNTDVVKFPTTDANGRNIQYINQRIKFVSSIEYNSNHHLIIKYNTTDTPADLGLFRSIDRVAWNDNLQLTVTYTDGVTEILTDYSMKYIDSINISNEGDLSRSQNLMANYVVGKKTDGTNRIESQQITSIPLNNVAAISLLGDNLIVLYSDPAVRAAIPASQRASAAYKGIVYNDWLNLGSILKGNHVFGVFPALTTPDGQGLKDLYPFGFGKDTSGNVDPATANFMGWVALVGNVTEKTYYAFDYNISQDWEAIETAESIDDPRNSIIVSEADVTGKPAEGSEFAKDNTIWFIIEE